MKKILIGFLLLFTLVSCQDDKAIEVEEVVNNDVVVEAENNEETEEVLEVVYKKITAEAAKELMTDEVIILDVRTVEEYNEGHIPNAFQLSVQDIVNEQIEGLDDKEQIILVYCRSGNRSKTASEKLIELGYLNVYDFGGIIDWPYDIEE